MNATKQGRAAWASLGSAGSVLLFLAAAALAFWALRHQFGQTAVAEVLAAVRDQPARHIALALALTAVSFAALGVYDVFGVALAAPGRVPAGVALLAGATASSFSNTLGFHAVTGSVVRARIYMRWGLTGAETVRIISLSWLALGLGFLAMVAGAEGVQQATLVRPVLIPGLGVAIAAGLLGFLAWLAGGQRELRIFRFRQPMPSARLAALLMAIGAVESASAIGALYVLIPADLAPPFSHFAVGCIGAVALGLVSHTPGGIGVFEASVTALLSGAGRADLLAALLLYRLIYNILPFLVSAATLGLLAARGAVNSKADTA